MLILFSVATTFVLFCAGGGGEWGWGEVSRHGSVADCYHINKICCTTDTFY